MSGVCEEVAPADIGGRGGVLEQCHHHSRYSPHYVANAHLDQHYEVHHWF